VVIPPPQELSALLVRWASEAGFHAAGVAPLGPDPDFARYQRWLAAGQHAEMRYLTRHLELRRDPRGLLPEARIALVVALGTGDGSGAVGAAERVAIYARGEDYHRLVRRRLKRLRARIRGELGSSVPARACVDTAPLLERSLARRAGLGWIGKNTCLIHPRLGSLLVLGVLLLGLDAAPGTVQADRCGDCRRCIDACPTGALDLERGLDARRCLSYLTIAHRGAIPESFHPHLAETFFGCDRCQQACPWNRSALRLRDPGFTPRRLPDLPALATLTEPEFRNLARASVLGRPGYQGFLRNVRMALEHL